MDNTEVMRIGDLKATSNTWKLILMRLVSFLVSAFVVFVSFLTFKIQYIEVIVFILLGIFNFFEIGVKASCLNYVRDKTEGVDIADIFYPFKSNPIRFIGLSLLSVAALPLLFIFELVLFINGVQIPTGGLIIVEITVILISKYLLFIIPYLAIDYPEENILEIIKIGLFFERKYDFIYIFFSKLPIPIIYIIIMLFNGVTPNGFLPVMLFYAVWVIGGTLSLIILITNIPMIDLSYAILYNNIIKTYYEEDDEDEVINPYVKEYEESYHEYGDFKSDDFLD